MSKVLLPDDNTIQTWYRLYEEEGLSLAIEAPI